jgi:ATP-dependent protease ClpP protease subunit
MKQFKSSKLKHTNELDNFDDMDEQEIQVSTLGYFEKQQVSCCITVFIDEAVKAPSYYRSVVNRILNTHEGDVIEFEINSGGGQRDGLVQLLSALDRTDANSIAYLNGSVHSAASMLALSCNEVYVSENANMLCHGVSYGVGGKGSDIYNNVIHEQKISKELFQRVYKNFLSPDEIQSCMDGKEIWLDANEIKSRLENRQNILMEEAQEEEEVLKGCSSNPDLFEVEDIQDFI